MKTVGNSVVPLVPHFWQLQIGRQRRLSTYEPDLTHHRSHTVPAATPTEEP